MDQQSEWLTSMQIRIWNNLFKHQHCSVLTFCYVFPDLSSKVKPAFLSSLGFLIKILNFCYCLSLKSMSFFLSPTIQSYWHQPVKMSSRKDNKFSVLRSAVSSRVSISPCHAFGPPQLMSWLIYVLLY